tara:strand:+ start:5337 stop:5609 length:273 start_codon:yes stop_codon:yes gene_type:complete
MGKKSSFEKFIFSPPNISVILLVFGVVMGYLMGTCVSAKWIYPELLDAHEDAIDQIKDIQDDMNEELMKKMTVTLPPRPKPNEFTDYSQL